MSARFAPIATATPVVREDVGTLPLVTAFDRRSIEIVLSDCPDDHTAWIALEATGRLTPFQSRAWLLPWYRIVAPALGIEPLVVTVQDRQTGLAMMVLPLCRRREGRLRIVEFAGDRVNDYNAPIFAAGFSLGAEAIELIMRLVRNALDRTHLVRFGAMPAFVDGWPNPMAGLMQARRLGLNSWAVGLPDARETYEAALPATFAKELRRKRRRLAGRGTVTFDDSPSRADAEAFFAALKQQRRLRFEELGRPDILSEPLFCSFYHAALFGAPDPVATMSALKVDHEIVATMLALHHRRTSYLVMSAFDGAQWKSCSPGALAIDAMASAMIARGFTTFDFTIGDEGYKRHFGAIASALYTAEMATSLRGAPTVLRGHIKAGLKRTLPDALLTHLRRR